MPNLTIDGRHVSVPEDSTILDAAHELGIQIPSLCFVKELGVMTSCMVCLVRVEGRNGFLPACGTKADDGMVVTSEDPAVHSARRTALELLLSDHVGDCIAPCQTACPANMGIPEMLRHIAAGHFNRAVEVVKEDIALPAVAGYICAAPCENACRRRQVDAPVSICLLKRYAAELDLNTPEPYRPKPMPLRDSRVAIIGSGPAGLAAAYYLQRDGFPCVVYDGRDEPGGMLRYGVSRQDLPLVVLDKEIEQIRRLGVIFRQKTQVGQDLPLSRLLGESDAVFLAIGDVTPDQFDALGIGLENGFHQAKKGAYRTGVPKLFAGGGIRHSRRQAIRSLADGKEAAVSISQLLLGEPVTGAKRPFSTRMGKLEPTELAELSAAAIAADRVVMKDRRQDVAEEEAIREAERCLRCDCRKAATCKLRSYADAYGAKAATYRGSRRPFLLEDKHPDLLFEPGKCISCGICLRITEKHHEALGLTFVGRGFDVRIAVPFNQSIAKGLTISPEEVAAACPTGALALR